MRYAFHPEALEEYDEAARYYAEQQPGLDLRFIGCVENAIEVILEDPLRWRPFDEDVRRCLTRVLRHPFYRRTRFCAHRRGCSLQP
jgi:plasmid stabilization system protein ParE